MEVEEEGRIRTNVTTSVSLIKKSMVSLWGVLVRCLLAEKRQLRMPCGSCCSGLHVAVSSDKTGCQLSVGVRIKGMGTANIRKLTNVCNAGSNS